MAIDAYMVFKDYQGAYLKSESQVDFSNNNEDLGSVFKTAGNASVFEVDSYSFDIEQTLNIGSQSSGAGAGKITFNPFSISRKIDVSSPALFQAACAGTTFTQVYLGLRKSAGGTSSGVFFLRFDFKLVAVKTISWATDIETPTEHVTFEYGGLQMRYAQQQPNGQLLAAKPAGWNRVKNVADMGAANI